MFVRSNSRFYVLAGLTMSENDWSLISLRFEEVMRNYFPTNIPEVHTHEIVGRRVPFNNIDTNRLLHDIGQFIRAAHITLFGIAIDKQEFINLGVGPPDHIVIRSVEEMVNRYHIFLQRNHTMGIMVSDASAVGFDTRIRQLYEYFRRQGTHFVQVRQIIDTIFFTPSETAIGIQLADFIGYAIRRHCEYRDSSLFDDIKQKFDTYAGEIHGFRIIPDPVRIRKSR